MKYRYTKQPLKGGAKVSDRQLVRRMWKAITRVIQIHAQVSLGQGEEILKQISSLDDSVSIIARHLARVEEEKRNASPKAE